MPKALDTTLFTLGGTAFTAGRLVALGVVLALLVLGTARLRRWIVEGPLARRGVDVGVRHAIASMVRYVVVFAGILALLGTMGVRLDALTVVAGALGVGVGLGLQQVTSNFVSGLILLVERPIKVGDRIEVDGVNGDVVRIAPRATTVVTNDNIAIIVPNSSFVTSTVVNWSHSDRNVRFSVPVGVSYSSDPENVRETLLAVAARHQGVLRDPPPDVVFVGFGDSAINFDLRVWTQDYITRPTILRSDLNFAIGRAFREAAIEIPFPQRDLHLRSGWPLAPGKGGPS